MIRQICTFMLGVVPDLSGDRKRPEAWFAFQKVIGSHNGMSSSRAHRAASSALEHNDPTYWVARLANENDQRHAYLLWAQAGFWLGLALLSKYYVPVGVLIFACTTSTS